LKLSPGVAARAAEADVRVARAFLSEISERVTGFIYEIPGGVFASVRQRVARHLLDLAAPEDANGNRDGALIARVTQQELADAVGTVREVVVRVLRALRTEGAVRTERDRIVIVDPASLIRELGWNQGS
jgi:CRP/FNR family transcriptional regulator, cyclic AMP receptor protein